MDLSQVTSTEILCGFETTPTVNEQHITLPMPQPIPLKNEVLCVYHRFEATHINKSKILFSEVSILSISLASQTALLGCVT